MGIICWTYSPRGRTTMKSEDEAILTLGVVEWDGEGVSPGVRESFLDRVLAKHH